MDPLEIVEYGWVDNITMSSAGNATDFGNLHTATRGASGMSGD